MKNKINLIKNNDNRNDSDIDKLIEFYNFLIGEEVPEGLSFSRGHQPKMSEKKAFSIIWYLQEHLPVFPDNIEKCSHCNGLYDTHSEGMHWESKGKFFCGGCDHLVPNGAR